MTSKGKTALITGPASGIGKQFAIQLAKEGYNLVLVSRSEDKLAALSDDLKGAHNIQAIYITSDLSLHNSPKQVYEKTEELGIEVDLLINNAGYMEHCPFFQIEWGAVQDLIHVDIMALVNLTHLYLPGMLARNTGHILNIGSVASFIPGPDYAVYSAAKAFVLSFSEALAEELRKTSVGVTCLCPGPVDTGFADRADLNGSLAFKYFPMSPQAVAATGIKALKKNKRVAVPGLINKLIVFLYRFAPRRLVIRLSRKVMAKQN